MNKDLKHDFYKLPEELLDTLNSNLKRTSDKANGYERLSNLCKNKGVNYGQAKKIKHEMENDLNPESYKLVGGDDLLDWVNDKLTRERKIVDGNKRVKMNAGLNNQFKKPHTKDTSKNSSKVRLVSTQKTSDEILNNRAVYNEASRIRDIIKKIIT
ncbi:hypothetical protein CL614_08070 [archaeon]|nr:hypothetical protein [archaeon]|tara:strand:+ start:1919 stop:2386 length:468 start_codon:yes stop_codon:yes gene_type:complete